MSSMPASQSTALVGRDTELQELISRLGIRASGRRGSEQSRAVLLAGDAGVGKTRLLTELRDVAFDRGWLVLAGHCLDLAHGSLPYLPFSEILGRVLTDRPEVAASVTERHPTLARLQPGRRLRTTDDHDSDQSLDRGNMFAAVHDLFETLAEAGPLLVVIEDTHWADQSTRDMLSFLFSRSFVGPVRMVVSYRSDDLHRRHPLRPQIAEWVRLSGVDRVQIDPLRPADVRRLVKKLHTGTLTEAEFTEIVDRAEGNAFFVEELVGASWATGGQIPADLADVLLVRLDGLDEVTLRVVRAASVAGRHVSHDLLQAVTGLGSADLEGALRAAVESNVLAAARNSAYAFRHALLGEAVYDDLLPGERTRLHMAFVEAIRGGTAAGTAAELALHARRAGDHETALRAAIEAGNEAFAVGGPSEAAGLFLAAIETLHTMRVPPDDVDEGVLVRRCAEALIASGRVSKAVKVLRAHLDAMPATAPAIERGQSLSALAAAFLVTDTTENEAAIAAEAVDLLADAPPRLLARALNVRARTLGRWNEDEARETAMRALALADRHNLVAIAVDVAATLTALDSTNDPDRLRSSWLEAAAKARAEGVLDAELRSLYFLGRFHHDRGELDEALDAYRQTVARGEASGLMWAPFPAEARFYIAYVLVERGDLDAAWDILDVSDQSPPLVFEWLYFALQVEVAQMRGEPSQDGLHKLRAHWSRDGLIALIAGTAELMAAEQRGDPDAALATYDQVVATVASLWHERFQARLRLATVVIGIFASAATKQTAGQRALAAESVTRLHEDGARVIDFYADYETARGPEYQAWVRRREAEHLRWRWLSQIDAPPAEELLAAWRAAEQAFVTHGNVYELVRVRVRCAEVLRASGDVAGARSYGDPARESAARLGAAPLLAELTALGAAGRAAPPSPASVGGQPAALTPRESEILALVAEGRTNGEIGKQLFISTKTVSVHVSNILGKFGAGSRTEAAAIARREGLL